MWKNTFPSMMCSPNEYLIMQKTSVSVFPLARENIKDQGFLNWSICRVKDTGTHKKKKGLT